MAVGRRSHLAEDESDMIEVPVVLAESSVLIGPFYLKYIGIVWKVSKSIYLTCECIRYPFLKNPCTFRSSFVLFYVVPIASTFKASVVRPITKEVKVPSEKKDVDRACVLVLLEDS